MPLDHRPGRSEEAGCRKREGGGDEHRDGDDSMKTIVIALLVNLAVAAIKAVAGVLSASAGLLAEAAHSVGDCTTELFLVTALRRSDKPPDRRHPFGYGKERYFWSLLAALTIFTLGAGFSVYQGVSTIVGGEQRRRVADHRLRCARPVGDRRSHVASSGDRPAATRVAAHRRQRRTVRSRTG